MNALTLLVEPGEMPALAGRVAYGIFMQMLQVRELTSGRCTPYIAAKSAISTQSMACSLIRSTLCKQPRTGDYTSTFLMGMKLVTMWSSSKKVVAKYYQTARDAIRRYDPNHLFVGDKINANTDSLDTVLPVTSQFTDLVFHPMYA